MKYRYDFKAYSSNQRIYPLIHYSYWGCPDLDYHTKSTGSHVLFPAQMCTANTAINVAARVSSLALLPQGKIEGARRAKAMVAKMDELGFGGCTNTRACEAECPKGISVGHIARLNREFLSAKLSD